MTLQLQKMGLGQSLLLFGGASLLLYVESHFLIPLLVKYSGCEPIIYWFLVGGVGVFGVLLLVAILILRREGWSLNRACWRDRLRFRAMTSRDLKYTVVGMLLSLLLSAAVMQLVIRVHGSFNSSPSFMAFAPLSAGRYWLLAIWLPYWLMNIFGEEILWRGVMLPRQQLVFGRWTWIVHGTGWGIFHLAFGWQLLATIVPLLYIESWVVQKTENTWPGVIMHAALNGPSFIAIALGLV